MDLIYSTVWDTVKPTRSELCGKVALCWSCRNLIAFTTGHRKIYKQAKSKDKTEKQHFCNAIHIVDPDKPWDVYSFESDHEHLIQHLLWDGTGSRLLSVDESGMCRLWAMKDYLLNDWYQVAEADVGEGESLVCISWIDSGLKVHFIEEQHATSKRFEDHFKPSLNKPPFTEFGGKAQDGWISISETGLICVTKLKPKTQITRKQLAPVRSHVAVSDLAYTSNGKVIVATNNGDKSTSVQFYRVQLKTGPKHSCHIESVPLPCLFPHSRDELENFADYAVTDIQFLLKNSGEYVLVCTTGPFGSCIKRWDMKKEGIQLHQKFQNFQCRACTQPQTFRWSCVATYIDGAQMTALALPRLPCKVDDYPGITYPNKSLAVGLDNEKIQVLKIEAKAERRYLLPVGAFHLQTKLQLDSEQAHKKTASAPYSTSQHGTGVMAALWFSPACTCLAGVTTTGHLSLFKFQHATEVVDRARFKRNLVDLFEYCLITGWDWWDVLIAAHIGAPQDTIDGVLKQLLDELSYQHPISQHMMVAKTTALKASLYRCTKDGSGQAMDCYATQFLFAVALALRSLPYCSQSNMEFLTKTCSRAQADADIDKVIAGLESEQYSVDPETLTAMHSLIKWIADLAMFIVAAFTTRHTKGSVPGVSLGRNAEVLGIIREMLVLIRIWGVATPSIVPSITPSADKKDSLALLFTIITKMWHHSKSTESQEIEERLAVEASPLLPNQLFLQNMKAPTLNRGISGKPVSGQVKPALYQFNVSPTGPSVCHSYNPFASAILPVVPDSPYFLDVVGRVFIDSSPNVQLKQCTRCSCVSQLRGSGTNLAMKTWDQRWVRSCVCGGTWKRYTAPQP
ncbi:mediator of RNA polymerase II transcription subunit 16 [Nematostella vectensis]|uniref:mediator of RNA polymerase II transcription subunit 16 n=1 Tax=Nematostella vectensis TaxID=45351 RepID=UPI00207751E5|nr:mediator of RNA polymerase II transcription subunit 16 [Nematostella vectensis]